MQFAAMHYTGVTARLFMLWVVVCSATQSMLGHLPAEVLQVNVVGEMGVKFREQLEWCLRLETLGSRMCSLILGLADDRVHLAVWRRPPGDFRCCRMNIGPFRI
jgi:hypothetical protein